MSLLLTHCNGGGIEVFTICPKTAHLLSSIGCLHVLLPKYNHASRLSNTVPERGLHMQEIPMDRDMTLKTVASEVNMELGVRISFCMTHHQGKVRQRGRKYMSRVVHN